MILLAHVEEILESASESIFDSINNKKIISAKDIRTLLKLVLVNTIDTVLKDNVSALEARRKTLVQIVSNPKSSLTSHNAAIRELQNLTPMLKDYNKTYNLFQHNNIYRTFRYLVKDKLGEEETLKLVKEAEQIVEQKRLNILKIIKNGDCLFRL